MEINEKILFIEINNFELSFIVGEIIENKKFKLIHSNSTPLVGIQDNIITDINLVHKSISENIYLIEQKLNVVFKDTVLVIDNFRFSLINLSGFKKLNGSQLKKENITYLLNSLKLNISEIDIEKSIIHIFSSKYLLDKKRIENLPIGLFGDLYSQELSFFLLNNNDLKNIYEIFNKCNLRIRKIMSKSFVEGANLINNNFNLETFFKIEINQNYSKIFFFENSALKFMQKFKFGTDLIIKDISKITAINYESTINILNKSNFSNNNSEEEYVEKDFFINQNFRKIKKNLIIEIARARIQELAEIIILKNVNFKSILNNQKTVFLKINYSIDSGLFNDHFKFFFAKEKKLDLKFIEQFDLETLYANGNEIVQFGWKSEIIPVVQQKKSIITKFFDLLFN